MALTEEKVFGGLRQAVVYITFSKISFELTYGAFMLTLLLTMIMYTIFGLGYVLTGIPLFAFCVLIERKEPRAFRLIGLWFLTTSNSGALATMFFGGSTRAPLSRAKGRERKTISL